MPLMARVTVTFTISLPPEMAEELEEVRKREHRTRSELIREALRRYVSSDNGSLSLHQKKSDSASHVANTEPECVAQVPRF